jgi:hypothetical protein
LTTGNDRDLEEGVCPLKIPATNSVASLVVSDSLLLLRLKDK